MKKLILNPRQALREASKVGSMCSSSTDEGLYEHVRGLNINYFRHGKGKHNVLCMPGALGSWRTDFKAQIEGPNALNGDDFTVIAWDPPGYGKSRPPDRDFSPGFFERDADFAHRLMFKLNLIPYSVLGWSDGGITGMFLAHQLSNTNVLRKLVLFGANAYITQEDLAIYEKIKDSSQWSEKMRAPLVELYGEEYFQTLWKGWNDAVMEIYDKNGGDLCRDLMSVIKFETLIIHGAKDPMFAGDEHPQFLRRNLRYSRPLVVHPEGKHNLHLRYADWFKKEVEEFLKAPPIKPKL